MSYASSITEGSAIAIAAQVGLDIERLKKDMEAPEIVQSIDRNIALAQALRITGTPGFVVGDEIARGLVDVDAMHRFIAKARSK